MAFKHVATCGRSLLLSWDCIALATVTLVDSGPAISFLADGGTHRACRALLVLLQYLSRNLGLSRGCTLPGVIITPLRHILA